MAQGSVINNYYNITVTDKGTLAKTAKSVEGLKGSLSNVGKIADDGSKGLERMGATGTITGRNLSRVANSVDMGIAPAYAKFAANIIAVTIAFEELRKAAQVEQVTAGIEYLGARSGLALNTTAQALREVTGAAISTEAALRATAQLSAAGFDPTVIERVGAAATDASIALGRNLNDSMDRLSKGITKLEPELIDELGITVKLDEATQAYALANNKAALSLSGMEKRVAFANAALAEAEAKFGGVAEAAGDTVAYEKLASSLQDAKIASLQFASVGLLPLIQLLGNSPAALVGATALFANTLAKSAIPGLYNTAEAARVAADSLAELKAKELKDIVGLDITSGNSTLDKALGRFNKSLENDLGTNTNSKDSLQKLDLALKEYQKEVDKTVEYNRKYSGSVNTYIIDSNERAKQSYRTTIAMLQDQRVELNELVVATAKYNVAERSANAITAASQLNIISAFREGSLAVKDYRDELIRTAGDSKTTSLASQMAMINVATAAKGATIGVKALGTAFLTAIPYIGAIAIALGIAKEAYDFATYSKAADEYKKSVKGLSEAVDSLSKSSEAYAKIANSTASYQSRLNSEYEVAANSINSVVDATEQLIQKRTKLDAQKGLPDWLAGTNKVKNNSGLLSNEDIKGFDELNRALANSSGLIADNSLQATIYNLAVTNLSGKYKTNKELLEALSAQYSHSNGLLVESTKETVALSGGLQLLAARSSNSTKFFENLSATLIKLKNQGISPIADEVKGATQSLKELDKETVQFLRGSIETTRYDGVVKQLDVVTGQLTRINSLSAKFGQNDESAKILAGISDSTLSLLSSENQARVRNATALSQEVQLYKQKLASGIQLSEVENRSYTAASRKLTAAEKELSFVSDNLFLVQQQFVAAQELERLTKSQVSLEQARLNRFSDLYSMTGAGEKKRIESEERVRGLQAAQLQAQSAILKSSIQQNKLTLERLQTEYKLSTEYEKQNAVLDLRNARQAYETALIKANGDEQNNLVVAAKLRLKYQEDFVANQEQQKKIQLENRDIQASITALDRQIAAITMANITAKEKEHRINIVNLKATNEIRDAERESAVSRASIFELEAKLTGLRTDNTSSFAAELAAYKAQNVELDNKVSASQDSLRLLKEETALVRATANAEGSVAGREAVELAEKKLAAAQRTHDTTVAIVSAQKAVNREETLGVKYATDYLNAKQENLSLVSRELDAMRDMIDARYEIATLEAKIAAARQGRELTATEERQLTIANLQDRVKFAKVERDIRVASISAEYALLAAQIETQKINLKAQQQARMAEGRDSDPYLTQLISDLDNLPSSLERAKASQIELLMLSGQALDKQLELAKIEGQNRSKAYNPFAGVKSVLNTPASADPSIKKPKVDTEVLQNGLGEAANDNLTTVIVTGATKAKEATESLIESINKLRPSLRESLSFYADEFSKLGPNGEAMSSAIGGLIAFDSAINTIGYSFQEMSESVKKATEDLATNTDAAKTAGFEYEIYKQKMEGVGSILSSVGSAIAAIGQIQQASSQASQNAIDQEISAEKSRDGQSSASLAKIKALEEKKDQMARKSFETNKKLQMAQAVVNTAAAVSFGLANPFPLNLVLAGIAGAMGAAQLALIASTSYQSASGSTNTSTSEAASLAIGNRSSSIDLAKGNTNAGGEIAYMRGAEGTGNGPSDFKPTPRAYGGSAYLVGEKGPEVIYPTTPSVVAPNGSNDNMGGAPVNVTLNVSAMDARGVDEVLTRHSGTIIEGIRGVANNSGINFLENVNTNINKARKM